MTRIAPDDIIASVRDALQYIACYHPPDFLAHLGRAHAAEQGPAARDAIAQILISSRMAAMGRRPICQDTGMVVVFARMGQSVRIDGARSLGDLVNQAVSEAWRMESNPLRASMVAEPLFDRRNTGDNSPAVLHVELVPGDTLELTIAAKGGGSENKAQFAVLNPGDSVADWVVDTVETLGAGWCPPGVLGIGVGGSSEKAMVMAKQAVMGRLDIHALQARGPQTPEDALRLEIFERVNALGIGAQGLGGMTTVLDVKLATYPTHAASLPVALMPQCAANRHATVTLDGSGPVTLPPPRLADWPEIARAATADAARRVDLDRLDPAQIADWRAGETLLLSGRLLTARDAAHKRLAELHAQGRPLPVDLRDRVIYYVGPVDPVGDEVLGPAGPTTSTRMDGYTDLMLDLGVLAMIGKAERGADTVAALGRARRAYLIAVGGAAVLVGRAIREARTVAFEDLGMEAIREITVEDMPVTVAIDPGGNALHRSGPAQWRRTPRALADPGASAGRVGPSGGRQTDPGGTGL